MDWNKIRLSGLNVIDLKTRGASFQDKYIFKGADGLGPTDVSISIANPTQGKGIFQNSTPSNRQIVIRIGLNPSWSTGQTPSDLRTEIYGLLTGGPSGLGVTVNIMKDNVVIARTVGYVSKLEPTMFEQDVSVSLTLECDGPYFEAPNTISQIPGGTKLLPTVMNVGTAPTGMRMTVTQLKPRSNFEIGNQNTKKFIRIPQQADTYTFTFDTFTDSPGVYMAPSDSVQAKYSALQIMDTSSDLFQLHGGLNTLYVRTIQDEYFGLPGPNGPPPVVYGDYRWEEFIYRPNFLGV